MPQNSTDPRALTGWRAWAYEIIFESDTPSGKLFDVLLIGTIVLSILVDMLESVADYRLAWGSWLRSAEWVFTALFTLEYLLRLSSAPRPARYATSFFGIVDLLAIVPTYLSVLLPGAQFLVVIRVFRILRVFRVLKLAHYVAEVEVMMHAMRASARKILVFMYAVVTLVVILGSFMYLIEGPAHGFTSIPRGVYWAIVTLTTVGYGDISPQTSAGQALAAVIMILGYGIIAVPTGIVTVEMNRAARRGIPGKACASCQAAGHDADAVHCKFCGTRL
jgi:voltage-gated potassium channel